MRLKRLDLMRYGKFTDRVLDFGDRPASGPDLHLIYGPNEAGKSTAFDAFLSLLFGVPSRSPYDFLHSYKTMQVGGLIETGHGPFDLIRTKANSHDLRRASGELLAPGALGAILGGLSREAYRAMFSLDEKSLEDGGKAILESQGELGQMLFAASSGLPGIAAVLEGARADADGLFKKSAHKTKMRELLNTLEALKKQQGDIDINASRYDDLRRAAEQAQAAHAKAEAGRNARSTRLREVRQLLAALPLAGKRAVKHALHAPLANLPAPPDGWIAQAGKLALDEAQLVARQAANDLAVARLMTDIAGLTPNVPMLAAAAQITTLKPLRARHDTAEIDLPKRIEARALAQDELSQKVRELGLAADVDPASLLLPAPVTAQLQALADQHIGLATGLDTAAAELRAVTQKRDAAQADMGAQEDTGAPAALRDDSALDDLLARLLRDSPHTEHARLAEELTHEARNVAAGLAALRPFSGTTAELASLSVPEAVALHRWSTALRSADDTLAREAGKVTDRETQLGSAIARSAALRAQPGLVDDAALATLASARTQAWQDHRAAIVRRSAALDPTADAYAAAASAERGALIARTHQAAALEAMRMAELAMAEAGHALDAAKLLHARALAARAQLQQEVDAALLACTLPTTLHVDDFAGWLKRRDDCLKAQSALAQREARLAALAHRMAHDRMQLADAGIIGAPEIPFAALVAQAQAATRAAAAAKSTRDAKAKAVAELTRQLAERTDRHTDLARRLQG